jgi:hypothetical protein
LASDGNASDPSENQTFDRQIFERKTNQTENPSLSHDSKGTISNSAYSGRSKQMLQNGHKVSINEAPDRSKLTVNCKVHAFPIATLCHRLSVTRNFE